MLSQGSDQQSRHGITPYQVVLPYYNVLIQFGKWKGHPGILLPFC
jgi:hypothetical protein